MTRSLIKILLTSIQLSWHLQLITEISNNFSGDVLSLLIFLEFLNILISLMPSLEGVLLSMPIIEFNYYKILFILSFFVSSEFTKFLVIINWITLQLQALGAII
ncbi:MAG: hypothetical protein ACTSVA_08640 [Candidatus Njordarchaeales archaeon]